MKLSQLQKGILTRGVACLLSVLTTVQPAESKRGAKHTDGTKAGLIPKRGVASSAPAARWDYGFLTGNGRIGVIAYGQPAKETIVFNHERLYLPHRRPEIPDLGQTFPQVRRIIRAKGHSAGRNFSLQQAAKQKHFNYHSDPFHLAFQLTLDMPVKGSVKNYLRTCRASGTACLPLHGMVPIPMTPTCRMPWTRR